MSNGTQTYPYWDAFNRYIVAGVTGKETVFAQLYSAPSGGYWRLRCYGNHSTICPQKLGPYFGTLSSAQGILQSHCQSVHYIIPPGGGPPVAPFAPEILDVDPDFGAKNSAFTLSVNGQNFTAASVIYFDGVAQTTTFTDSSDLSCAILATQVPTDRAYSVQVIDPTTGNSNVFYFTATT